VGLQAFGESGPAPDDKWYLVIKAAFLPRWIGWLWHEQAQALRCSRRPPIDLVAKIDG
jgi:hypothetical protein